MMDTIEVRRLKIILLFSSLVCLVFLGMSAYQEQFAGAWRTYQQQYRTVALERANNDAARAAIRAMRPKFQQIFLPNLDRIDRCTTCHIGIDDPGMADQEVPLRAHSGTFLKDHPMERFGCTVCHDGQPRAVKLPDAHGEAPFWERPLLRGERVYSSCSRCHYEADLFGAEDDLFAGGPTRNPIYADELASTLPGVENANDLAVGRGKQLVLRYGCLGCHKYRGRGGTLGPDITYVGDKTAHDFDFTHVHGEHTVEHWLFEHFMHPAAVSPTTLMPDFGFSEDQARDLTQYMLSLRCKKMPASVTPMPPRHGGELASGRQLYGIFCSGCHGANGEGSTAREYNVARAIDAPPELLVPSLSHPDTLAIASDDYFRAIISGGRPHTNMIAWAEDGGLQADEIDRIVGLIRSWQAPVPDLAAISSARGNARFGRLLYRRNCQACHGRDGEGGIGNSLRSPSFLAVASDRFLAETIVFGRPNTAMPSWRQLDAQQISDLLAFLRGWHAPRSDRSEVRSLLTASYEDPDATAGTASVAIGRMLYKANCLTCHGLDGRGDLAPTLNTQEFLTLVGDDYLYDTIASGRPGTGMPAWHHLSSADIASLILYIRSWQTRPSRELDNVPIAGDWDSGRRLYAGACAGCHGPNAEGAVGPQLNNPVFLRNASDAMLREWIRYGKLGTPMRGFLKGGQGTAELRESQIDDIVAYLRSLERSDRVWLAKRPSGRPELGRLWYKLSCVQCHGETGEGSSGPALANPGFLRVASDGFLMATMALGRDGTEMRPVKKSPESILSLSSDQVNDIVAYLRSWEYDPPQRGIAKRYVVPWDLERGERLYRSNCAGCHGIDGKAELDDPARLSAWAPNLNNKGFLAAATDGFLQATIVRGRAGTAMRPFGHGAQGVDDLSAQDIDDIVAYIRRWSDEPGLPITIPAEIRVGGEAKGASEQQARDSSETTSARDSARPAAPVAAAQPQGD